MSSGCRLSTISSFLFAFVSNMDMDVAFVGIRYFIGHVLIQYLNINSRRHHAKGFHQNSDTFSDFRHLKKCNRAFLDMQSS